MWETWGVQNNPRKGAKINTSTCVLCSSLLTKQFLKYTHYPILQGPTYFEQEMQNPYLIEIVNMQLFSTL